MTGFECKSKFNMILNVHIRILKESDCLEVKNMAPKKKVKGLNPRLCRTFLKQRSKRASQLFWPKNVFY